MELPAPPPPLPPQKAVGPGFAVDFPPKHTTFLGRARVLTLGNHRVLLQTPEPGAFLLTPRVQHHGHTMPTPFRGPLHPFQLRPLPMGSGKPARGGASGLLRASNQSGCFSFCEWALWWARNPRLSP